MATYMGTCSSSVFNHLACELQKLQKHWSNCGQTFLLYASFGPLYPLESPPHRMIYSANKDDPPLQTHNSPDVQILLTICWPAINTTSNTRSRKPRTLSLISPRVNGPIYSGLAALTLEFLRRPSATAKQARSSCTGTSRTQSTQTISASRVSLSMRSHMLR
jgi:hypothetical protein